MLKKVSLIYSSITRVGDAGKLATVRAWEIRRSRMSCQCYAVLSYRDIFHVKPYDALPFYLSTGLDEAARSPPSLRHLNVWS